MSAEKEIDTGGNHRADSADQEQRLLAEFKKGNKNAANDLIGLYFDRVLVAAEKRLSMRSAQGSTPDDIAVSVFESLWNRANHQRFAAEDLSSPEELWRLLSKLVQFKTDDHARRSLAKKRGEAKVRGESVFVANNESLPGIAGQAGNTLSPEERIILEEGVTDLMQLLNDPTLQKIALMRMENYLVSEIAEAFEKSERWVKRKLALIRDIWADQTDQA